MFSTKIGERRDAEHGTYLCCLEDVQEEELVASVPWSDVLASDFAAEHLLAVSPQTCASTTKSRKLTYLEPQRTKLLKLLGERQDATMAALLMYHVDWNDCPASDANSQLVRFLQYSWVFDVVRRCDILGIPLCDLSSDDGAVDTTPLPRGTGGLSPSLIDSVIADRLALEKLFRDCNEVLPFGAPPDAAAMFLKLVAWIRSRWIEFSGAQGAGGSTQTKKPATRHRVERHAVVPFVEKLNHDAECHNCPEVQWGESVGVRVMQPLCAGAELCINYGPHTNERFLALYGFVPSDNPYESFTLDVAHLVCPPNGVFPDSGRWLKSDFAGCASVHEMIDKLAAAAPRAQALLQQLDCGSLRFTFTKFTKYLPLELVFALAVIIDAVKGTRYGAPAELHIEPLADDEGSSIGSSQQVDHGGDLGDSMFGCDAWDDRSKREWLSLRPCRTAASVELARSLLELLVIQATNDTRAALVESITQGRVKGDAPHLGFWALRWCDERIKIAKHAMNLTWSS